MGDEEFSEDDIIVMACVWDEAQGPMIISRACTAGHLRYDFSPVALQIYMSSLTVFGQTGKTQKAEFTVPLYTISPSHVVRVAFDGWEDPSVRGEIRTYFLAFIFPNSLTRMLNPYLDTAIWTYMEGLGKERFDYDTEGLYREIQRVIQVSTGKYESLDATYAGSLESYSIQDAISDLRNASAIWTRLQDGSSSNFERDWLQTRMLSEKVAKKLQTVDFEGAGEAYFLLASAEAKVGRHQEAYEAFSRAADCFRQAVPPKLSKAGEALFNAAVSSFQNKDYGLAREALLTAVDWVKDVERLAELNFYLARSLHELQVFDKANSCFESSIAKAIEVDAYTLAIHASSAYADSLESQSKLRARTSESYAHSLLEVAGSQRARAAELLEIMGSLVDAGIALQMALRSYLGAKNYKKAIEFAIQAAELFERGKSFKHTTRAYIDAARLAHRLDDISAALEYSGKAIRLIRKQYEVEKDNQDPILGKALREQARALEKKNRLPEAIQSYQDAISNLTDSTESQTDLGSVQLALANLFYQIEFYTKAADLFVNASENIEGKQSELSFSNAYICFKMASQASRQAGNIALMNGKESEAVIQFLSGMEEISRAIELAVGRKRSEALELLSDMKNQIRRKLNMFTDIRQREQLKAVLEGNS